MVPMDVRNNLLRFGGLLFLYPKKRGHSSSNWSYTGHVIKYHNMNIGVVSETIVIAEDLDPYG